MASSSWLYIGLGIVLGFLFLGILAELYYLLWRNKKRINNTTDVEDDRYTKQLPLRQHPTNPPGFHHDLASGEDLLLKTTAAEVDADDDDEDEEEEDLELKGIYNLAAQPRFLFTINEETKEDLESEDGKSRKGSRNRSLSDIVTAIETPFFTPMASPPLKASPLSSLESYNYKLHGLNPLFESSSSSSSSTELEQNLKRLRSSPPPTFKFLRDAEEKLYKRLMEESQRKAEVPKNEQRKPISNNNQRFHYSSSSSQVLPLISSPP